MRPPGTNSHQLKILDRIYGRAADDLAGLLGGSDFQRGKSAKLLKQVNLLSRRLGTESDQWVVGNVAEQYRQGAAFSDKDLLRIGVDLPIGELGGDFLKINEGAVDAFATQLARDMAGANQNLTQRAKRIISRTSQKVLADPSLSEVIARGLVSGGSVNNIGRSLRKRLAEGGRELLESGQMTEAELLEIADFEAGYIQTGKARMKITKYCNLVAHYQLREAVTHATKQRLTEQGRELGDDMMFDLVVIVGPISGDFCDFYVGKIFSISGRHPDYPPLDSIPGGGPPFHPNCTHNIAPFVDRLASAREKERGRINPKFLGIDGRAAQKSYGGQDRIFAARRKITGQNEASSVAEPVAP